MNNIKNFFAQAEMQEEVECNWFSKESLKEFCRSNPVIPVAEYKRKAAALLQNCNSLLTCKEWQIMDFMAHDDVVLYVDRPKPEGRYMRIMGVIKSPAKELIDSLFDDIESGPTWNKLVSESTKLHQIDENTDIVYQVTSPQVGGIIGARDFVMLRHRNKCGEYYISSGTSVPVASIPNRKNVIRAESRVTCFAATDLSEENTCCFTFILNTNLKGWIPEKIVNKAQPSVLVEFMSHLRQHLNESQRLIA